MERRAGEEERLKQNPSYGTRLTESGTDRSGPVRPLDEFDKSSKASKKDKKPGS